MSRSWSSAFTVYKKELLDALRDRRTLLAVILSSVAVGPLVLVLISALVSDIEKRAEAREVLMAGIEHAPTLRNFLERQTLVVKPAPADYERRLVDKTLGDPVIVVSADFEAKMAQGEAPLVEIVRSSANTRAESAVPRLTHTLRAFDSEQAVLRLATRGVMPAMVQTVRVEDRDLANPAARSATFTGMLPFFVLMAVLYGAMTAALDTTAGERERGSLEPLLMNPAPRAAIVAGKWAAVATVGMLIAVMSCLSFLPGQWLLQSETLAAMFQFGIREAALFIGLLAPLAAALSSVMMAIAIRSKSIKEAQASNALVIFGVSMLPLVNLFNQGGEQAWHLWVPVLAQSTLMGRVLRGEVLSAIDVLLPMAVALVLAAVCVVWIARHLTSAAVR
jgi:sodium transport system permease protein